MSENDPTPSKQTSSIPLKKETVRVTLKAADAPPAAPSASIPSAPTVRPPTPTAPPTATAPAARPTPTAPPVATGAPTAPGAPRPAPAPTIPLKTAPAAGIPKPAPTIPLKTGPAAVPAAPGTAPAARPSLPGAPASTVSLPKATVQLTPPSQPSVGIPTQKAATYTTIEDEEEEVKDSPIGTVLAGLAAAAALAVLWFQIDTAGKWINAEDNENKGQWFAELTK
jgi:hypothetical protein